MRSLAFRITLLFILYTVHASGGQSLNLTTIFDNRLVHLIRQATSALSQKPQSDRNLTKILQSLELQTARIGDPCDRKAWATYMKPIYEALFKENFASQKNQNDKFALAILKEPTVMSSVCMSTTEVLECHENGKCDCLTILPSDLQGKFRCELRKAGEDGAAGEVEGTITGNVLGFFKNLFAAATTAASSGNAVARAQVGAIGFSIASLVILYYFVIV